MTMNNEAQIESSLKTAEREAEDICDKIEDLDKKIDEIKAAIARLSSDDEVRASLASNLSVRESEKEQEQRKSRDIESDIDGIISEIEEYERMNDESSSEVSSLERIGEDVSAAESIIQQRKSWISERSREAEEIRSSIRKYA